MTKEKRQGFTMFKKISIIFCSLLFLGACSTTLPVAVIDKDGRVLTGSATASLSGSSFQVSDGELTCSGNYDGLNTSVTITMNVACSDGRKGFVTAHREASGQAGSGTVTLNDGYTANFVFGAAARPFIDMK